MTCHTKHSKNAQFQWFKDFVKIEPNERITVDGHHIIIRNSSSLDNGLYSCRFRQTLGNSKLVERNFQLNVDVDQSIQSGDLLDRIVKTPSGCCRNGIIEMHKEDGGSGLYLCRKKRSDRTQEFVSDNIAPENMSKQSETTVTIDESESVTLGCDIGKGKKTPSVIKWKKDGKPFRQIDINSPASIATESGNMESSPQRDDGRISINRKNGSLTFAAVISSDHGIYECNTFHENDNPISSRKTNLNVIEVLKFVPQPTSKNLEMGTIGKVHCKVQGTPTPQVKWTKDNSESLPSNLADVNGTLIFKNVTIDDKGNYTCVASNTQGIIKATVSITAVVTPKFLVAPKGPIQAYEMNSVMIHCQATGDPMPTIQWDKDLEYIVNNDQNSSRFHILENGTLHIVEIHLDDEGAYGCTIGSSAGLKREEIRLNVKAADEFTAEESGDGFMITRAVLITMSVAFAYIILVVGLMLWCRYRRQARKARLNEMDKEMIENGNGEIHKMAEFEPCLPGNHKQKANGKSNHNKSDNAQKSDDTVNSVNSKTSKKSTNFDQITVPRNALSDLTRIGNGDFGEVFIGKIKTSEIKTSDDSAKTAGNEKQKQRSKTSLNEISEIKEEPEAETEFKEVLVKALNNVKDENVCIEFRRQIEMFRAISHRNVTKLYGLCRDKDPHYLVLEYADWGDLKQFLISTNDANDSTTKQLKNREILSIAHQIARAMDAIYRSRYIHRDLAARNCVITSNLVAKVSYPSLLDTYSKEYFKHKNSMIPLRWMAPECLGDDDFSTKSDVFAYGVLVWELYTRAAGLPLEELTDDEFMTLAKENKLERKLAEQTPTELKTILTSCWNVNPKERPSFSQLSTVLGKSLQSECP
ncbi:hypothetical protein HA402_008566 [Bradysia odoriphaga]|nr:hypothetical protein HA402_008566 [Bradysia odoriphaga]